MRENFSDIDFLKGLGYQDIFRHLQQASSRASYISTTSADEFLKCRNDHLENAFLDRLIASSEFSLIADETTDIADRAELSIFIRHADSDIVGSKGTKELFDKICEVLQGKAVDVTLMRFNGFNGTNTMSGEISGLQRRFSHINPHSKYINCWNHRLALVFVHIIPNHKCLKEVNASIIA